jgi:hypothetical protein
MTASYLHLAESYPPPRLFDRPPPGPKSLRVKVVALTTAESLLLVV